MTNRDLSAALFCGTFRGYLLAAPFGGTFWQYCHQCICQRIHQLLPNSG
ncbi:hypothetical protein [Rothia mucilaginosa]|nr:hypothetical protein [uncultured Rothia sp.]